MLVIIAEIIAGLATILGSVYLILFMASRIIPSWQAKWKCYLGKALFFYGIVMFLTMVSIVLQVPIKSLAVVHSSFDRLVLVR